MAALPPVSKTIQTAVHMGLGDGTPAISRFFMQYTGTPPTGAQLATYDAAVGTAWNSNLAALMDTGGGTTDIKTIDLNSASGAVDDTTVSHSGTRGASFIGGSSCCVVSYRIARRYRGGHPRGYWPFGIQTDLSDRNTWKSTFTSAATTGFTNFFTAVAAAVWTGGGTLSQVNVSYYSGFTVVTNPITHRARNVPTLRGTPVVDAVTALFVQPQLGSQRRRDANR